MADSAVVYTAAGELPAATRALIADVGPAGVIVVGGHVAVGAEVEAAIRDAAPGIALRRIAGASRVDTARLGAVEALARPAASAEVVVFVANGWSPSDIGVAAAWSARTPDSAVVYTAGGQLPAGVAELLGEVGPRLVRIIGGEAAVSAAVRTAIEAALPAGSDVRRISGATRTHTAALAARTGLPRP